LEEEKKSTFRAFDSRAKNCSFLTLILINILVRTLQLFFSIYFACENRKKHSQK
jgi:hypothetical protein